MQLFKIVDYIYSVLLVVSFLSCTVQSIRSQSLLVARRKRPTHVSWMVAGIVASYGTEGILQAVYQQITLHACVFTESSILVWSTIWILFQLELIHLRHSYFGSCLITCTLEVARFIVLAVGQSINVYQVVRLTIPILRIFLLVGLSIPHRTPHLASEVEPLLEQPQASDVKSWRDCMEDLLVVIPYLRPKDSKTWSLLCLVGVLQVLARPLAILPLIQTGALVDAAIDRSGSIPVREFVLWVMALLAFVPNRFNSCIKGHVMECLMRNLKEHALRHVMTLSMDFHSNNGSGEVLEVMVLGERYIHLADSLILDSIPSAIDVVTFVVYFSHFIDAYVGLIVIDVIVIHIWTELVKNPKLFRMHQDYSTNRCKESQIKYDTVTYWDLVKTANCQDQEWRGYSSVLVDGNKLGLRMKCLQLFAGLSGEGSKAIGLAISVLVLLLRLTQDTASVGGLFILIGSWPNTFAFIGYLVRTYDMLMGCLSAGERFSKLLRTKPSIVDKEGATHLEVTAGRVEFDNVSFSYADDEPAVKKISFTIEGGKTVALVGLTGSGKSTLLNLLKRFIDPSEGSIKIDGQNISDVTLRSLRENIAVVPQNLEMPNKSIREIVSYGLRANDVEIVEGCKAASIHKRIIRCNAGYNTLVGQGGIRLSGGERQRVTIARAFLKNPKILLLDEATSAVDNITEKSIRESLKSWGKGRTILTVAHRLSTVKGADEIIVLEKGEVKERGSHTELLNRRGSYYDMWTATDDVDGTEGVGS